MHRVEERSSVENIPSNASRGSLVGAESMDEYCMDIHNEVADQLTEGGRVVPGRKPGSATAPGAVPEAVAPPNDVSTNSPFEQPAKIRCVLVSDDSAGAMDLRNIQVRQQQHPVQVAPPTSALHAPYHVRGRGSREPAEDDSGACELELQDSAGELESLPGDGSAATCTPGPVASSAGKPASPRSDGAAFCCPLADKGGKVREGRRQRGTYVAVDIRGPADVEGADFLRETPQGQEVGRRTAV